MKSPRTALTTGQAARCCLVTSDTILNWIKASLIPAQRTAGGQYRILVDDLRAFMKARGMTTRLLDGATGSQPLCWQFHAERERAGQGADPRCEGCIVYFLGVLHCYRLMGMRPEAGRVGQDCNRCAYYLEHGEGATDLVPAAVDADGT